MKYKLIGLDFDGTLLTSDKQISKKTKDALIDCKKNGYIIVGITARSLGSAKDVVPLELFDYLLLNNGAYLYNTKDNNGKYIGIINKNEVEQIANLINSNSSKIEFISGENYYICNKNKQSKLDFIKYVDNISEITEKIARMNIFLSDTKNINYYYQLIKEKYKNINCFIMQDSDDDKKWIVINPKGINKESTLKKLGQKLNITLDEMIFFGDGLNDLEVMKAVGYGIAMGNALNEIKNIANEVTLSNDEDGIAFSLNNLNSNIK